MESKVNCINAVLIGRGRERGTATGNFERLSEDQVKKLNMKSPNKQCASDPIPTWMLKECLDIILPFLAHIVNLSLQTGHFADAWKEALLSPLLKTSNNGVSVLWFFM